VDLSEVEVCLERVPNVAEAAAKAWPGPNGAPLWSRSASSVLRHRQCTWQPNKPATLYANPPETGCPNLLLLAFGCGRRLCWIAGPRVCAYVTVASHVRIAPTEALLLQHCRDALPAAAVPLRAAVLPKLPLGPAGKVLRGELPEPVWTSPLAGVGHGMHAASSLPLECAC